MIALGIDIGSLFAKAVVMKEENILASAIKVTTGNIADEIDSLIAEMLGAAGLNAGDIASCMATGNGSDLVKVADSSESDLFCMSEAMRRLMPSQDLVLDLGGQNITSIVLDEQGNMIDFMRNDKCASGSGRFLEVMSTALGVDINEVDEVAARATKKVSIGSQCGVFVESEVITHVNQGESTPDILAGICDSVAKLVVSQALRFGPRNYTFTGGVARLRAVTDLARERLIGTCQEFPHNPQLAAAIGAALLAGGA